MADLNELLARLRMRSSDITTLTDKLRDAAARGLAPEGDVLTRLQSVGAEIAALRDEIDAVMKRQLNPDKDYSALTLEELETCAAECELNRRLCAGMAARLAATLQFLKRSEAPLLSEIPIDGMPERIVQAAGESDIAALRDIEARIQPYTDLRAAVRGEEALRQDPALINRLNAHYPQIAWYIRAQGRTDAAAPDELSDKLVTGLRNSRSDEDQLINAGDAQKPRRRSQRGRASAEAAAGGKPDAQDDAQSGF